MPGIPPSEEVQAYAFGELLLGENLDRSLSESWATILAARADLAAQVDQDAAQELTLIQRTTTMQAATVGILKLARREIIGERADFITEFGF